VLVTEVVAMLRPQAGGVYVDCTVGLGGHTAALLDAGAGRVIGLDRDTAAIARARERLAVFGDRVELVHADYRRVAGAIGDRGVRTVSGILADFGVSSMQLDDPARGFSFRSEGPLDMRMDTTQGEPLAVRLQRVDERTLADVIFRFGEERRSRRVARAILAVRDRGELRTTTDLAAAARRGAGTGTWQRLDPATRTFQALRIWVNDELEGLAEFVTGAAGLLEPGGRLAVIAFHSLEDRQVKQAMRDLAAAGGYSVITRRPVQPGETELSANPRARSARLRVVEKMA
jgi:16S rRNA (cytosine1402-N4)-methyltransferase